MFLELALLTSAAVSQPEDAVEILLDAERPIVDAARDLAHLRPFPVQEMFWILQGDEIPAAWTPDRARDVYLTPRQRQTIQFAFGSAPHTPVVSYLQELALVERGVETKATIVEILGWIGTVADLPTLLLAAAPESERYLAPARLRVVFGDALVAMLGRNPEALEPELPWVFRNAHSGLRMEVVRIVEERRVGTPLEILARMLGVFPDFDVLVLQTMHVIALRPRTHARESTLRAVRPFLFDEDPACIRLACRTLGAMEDVESVGSLIQLLDTEDPNLRSAAAYGLSVGTHLNFEENVLRWRSWYERERMWWEESAQDRFNELAHGDVAIAMRALVDVSERSFDRHALAVGVAPALRREEQGVVLTTCAFLARLGSDAVVEDMIPLLDDDDKEIRSAAWRALVRITGARLAPDSDAWSSYLGSIER